MGIKQEDGRHLALEPQEIRRCQRIILFLFSFLFHQHFSKYLKYFTSFVVYSSVNGTHVPVGHVILQRLFSFRLVQLANYTPVQPPS